MFHRFDPPNLDRKQQDGSINTQNKSIRNVTTRQMSENMDNHCALIPTKQYRTQQQFTMFGYKTEHIVFFGFPFGFPINLPTIGGLACLPPPAGGLSPRQRVQRGRRAEGLAARLARPSGCPDGQGHGPSGATHRRRNRQKPMFWGRHPPKKERDGHVLMIFYVCFKLHPVQLKQTWQVWFCWNLTKGWFE